MDRYRVRITADAAPIRLSISRSILPSLVNKTPTYLNSSTWGRISSPIRRGHSTLFRSRTMDSDLEVLTLIPTASHSAANRSSESWRSRPEEANSTTSSAKSRDAMLRSPNRTPSTPRLRLEILSIKIMNPHWERIRLTTGSADQTLASVIQGPNRPYQLVRHPVLPKHPPHNLPRDTVERLLQVHKTHVDWLGELPCTLEDPAEGVELVHCSTARSKATLFLLDPRLDLPTDPPLQHP
nr:uncharacterized protein LOC125967159 [Syngnathus scovelli]